MHLFWIISRAAGSAALVLSSVGVSFGLLMGGRFVKRRGLDLRALHEALSLATLALVAVHALTLLGDSYLKPTLLDITVPLASGYMTFYTSIGIVAGWALLALGLSYYARGRIGPKRWRKLHRFTALAWLLGLVHSLGEGSDAGKTWFLAMLAVVVVPALGLLAARMSRRPAAPAPAAQTRSGDTTVLRRAA
jgi:methionine sulfoxide reductase heme-binding subunit